MNLLDLSLDLWMHMTMYLSALDWIHLGWTCHTLFEMSQNPCFWKKTKVSPSQKWNDVSFRGLLIFLTPSPLLGIFFLDLSFQDLMTEESVLLCLGSCTNLKELDIRGCFSVDLSRLFISLQQNPIDVSLSTFLVMGTRMGDMEIHPQQALNRQCEQYHLFCTFLLSCTTQSIGTFSMDCLACQVCWNRVYVTGHCTHCQVELDSCSHCSFSQSCLECEAMYCFTCASEHLIRMDCTWNESMSGNHSHAKPSQVCAHQRCLQICFICKKWTCPMARKLNPKLHLFPIKGRKACFSCH